MKKIELIALAVICVLILVAVFFFYKTVKAKKADVGRETPPAPPVVEPVYNITHNPIPTFGVGPAAESDQIVTLSTNMTQFWLRDERFVLVADPTKCFAVKQAPANGIRVHYEVIDDAKANLQKWDIASDGKLSTKSNPNVVLMNYSNSRIEGNKLGVWTTEVQWDDRQFWTVKQIN